ncbi:MAG TPA: hypothetical protein VLK82_21355 [Candidatus Tectomicrobia bacterium]|nr:hypothetical protein [Candidatus Tectomicrobia bacterium]
MKKRAWHVAVTAFAVLVATLVTPHFSGLAAAQARKGVKAATGPFSYDPANAGSGTFLGSDSGSYSYPDVFQICAPGGGTIFPTGVNSATADIRVFGVEQVADAEGNLLLDPIDVPLDSALGMQIAAAFWLDPSNQVFDPGKCVDVDMTVYNPLVEDADYGDYVVTIKAHAPGSGIGVGSGARYYLSLRGGAVEDETAPIVAIDSPSDGSTHLLGVLDVKITATDPLPGTGVVAMSATVSSAGGAVSDEAIALTDDTPQAAGSPATASGTFTPAGGNGSQGTTLAEAFTSASRSGIGTYTLTAEATDGAGNVGTNSSTFQVTYNVTFTTQDTISGGSTGRFKFTVKRSSNTSDGAFMFDKTVVVQLLRTSDNSVVESHFYGTGAVHADVQIDAVVPEYKTNFRRADLPGSPSSAISYKARVLFLDVDGNLIPQGESSPLSF